MRISVLTGVLACTLVFAASSAEAGASTNNTLQIKESGVQLAVLPENEASVPFADDKQPNSDSNNESESQNKETKHIVQKSEYLAKIARTYETTWKRIYDKNTQIADPDIINPGDELIIPEPTEKLTERELPEPEPIAAAPAPKKQPVQRAAPAAEPKPVKKQPAAAQPTQSAPTAQRGSSSGNLYTAGYCTWYVKNRRPDLPNNLGNAATWYTRAAAQGMAVGSTPVAGAVGQRNNHVVYVESVNGDGTVTISEMNYRNLYERTVRTVSASYFRYIY